MCGNSAIPLSHHSVRRLLPSAGHGPFQQESFTLLFLTNCEHSTLLTFFILQIVKPKPLTIADHKKEGREREGGQGGREGGRGRGGAGGRNPFRSRLRNGMDGLNEKLCSGHSKSSVSGLFRV